MTKPGGDRPFVGVNPHRVLLSDSARTEAYAAALAEAVTPGMSVLDLGTGSGILAMLAARAGAGRVIGVDVDPIVRLARQVVEANGLGHVVTLLETDSRDLDLGPEIDLIVTECMGNFFVTDEMQRAVADARRFLRPGGRFLPSRIDLFLAPVFFPQLHEIEFWREEHYGLSFDPMVAPAENQCYVHHVPAEVLIGPAVAYDRIELHEMRQDLDQRVSLPIERALTLHGFVGWFDAQLTPSLVLSTSPGAARTHWAQTLFPIPPVSVRPGDAVDLRLRIGHSGDRVQRVRWEGEVRRGEAVIGAFDHDSDRRFGP